jgi:hypothetical protein
LQKLKEYCQGRSLFSIRYNFCIPTIGDFLLFPKCCTLASHNLYLTSP